MKRSMVRVTSKMTYADEKSGGWSGAELLGSVNSEWWSLCRDGKNCLSCDMREGKRTRNERRETEEVMFSGGAEEID